MIRWWQRFQDCCYNLHNHPLLYSFSTKINKYEYFWDFVITQYHTYCNCVQLNNPVLLYREWERNSVLFNQLSLLGMLEKMSVEHWSLAVIDESEWRSRALDGCRAVDSIEYPTLLHKSLHDKNTFKTDSSLTTFQQAILNKLSSR